MSAKIKLRNSAAQLLFLAGLTAPKRRSHVHGLHQHSNEALGMHFAPVVANFV